MGNPIRFVDPTGMDYWSTSDPNEIERFMQAAMSNSNTGGSFLESFNYSSWSHATDAEFLSGLTFNDEKNMFYTSFGTVENGEFTLVGVSIPAWSSTKTSASIEGPRSRWYKRASGAVKNVYPEFGAFFGSTRSGWSILRNLFSSMSQPMPTVNTFNAFQNRIIQDSSTKNIKKISDSYLKQNGIDAHALKTEFVGKRNIAHYDLYKDNVTNEILILKKFGKGVAQHTGLFVDK
jgi:hypothetical protein